MSTALQSNSSDLRTWAVKLKTLSFRTPWWLYAAHRFMFRITNGLWNKVISSFIYLLNGRYANIPANGSLFSYSQNDIDVAAKNMEQNGYHVFDQRLPDDLIDKLVQFSQMTPVKFVLPTADYKTDGIQFSKTEDLVENVKNKFARCPYDNKRLLENSDVVKVLLDPMLLSVAQAYLKVKPILSSIEMWWSFPTEDKEKFAAASAQKFHFDMDQIKFFNFFFYLTDVDEDNGPHVFVKGSHRSLPAIFRKRGRFQDRDVESFYGDNVIEIKGRRGTVLAVDTRGIHKGKILVKGERLLLQMRFANSLFGAQYPKCSFVGLKEDQKSYVNRFYSTYFNYL